LPAKPSLIALDVNETLSDMSPLGGRLEEVGAPAYLLARWFASTLRDGFALTAAGAYADFASIAQETLRSILSEVDGLTRNPAEGAEFVLSGMGQLPLHADVRLGLERLRRRRVRLVALTNGSAENTRQLLEGGGVSTLVERCFSVDEVGRWKPAPEPYRHAAEASGVEPDQVMLVAVHPWDVDGAKRAGLGACWINREAREYPEPFAPPDLICSDFAELADVLSA
jgi:2-haloacid dehalogenase